MQNDLAQHAGCCRLAAFHQMAVVHHCRSRAHIHQVSEGSNAHRSPLPHILRHNALVLLCHYLNMRISIHSATMFSGSRVMSSTCTCSNHQLSFFRCPQVISIQVSNNTTLKKILVSLHPRSTADRREITKDSRNQHGTEAKIQITQLWTWCTEDLFVPSDGSADKVRHHLQR